MKTMADVKRRVRVGLGLTVENFLHPEASGRRTVVVAQTKSMATLPEGADRWSWVDYPKSGQYRIEDDSLTFLLNGEPAFVYTFDAAVVA